MYLITYAQADVLKVPSRRTFGEMVASAWPNPEKWVVSCEMHKHDGVHFHCAIKLLKPLRWKNSRKYIKTKYNIDVDFLGFHTDYADAYGYTTKLDTHFVQEPEDQVDLRSHVPRTTKASRARRLRDDDPQSTSSKGKKPRLDNSGVGDIIVTNNLRTDDELCNHAKKLRDDGKDDLSRWIMNKTLKARMEAMSSAWRLVEAGPQIIRSKKPRLEILREALEGEHTHDPLQGRSCRGEWLDAALEVLQNNHVSVGWFTQKIRETLEFGRSKKKNLMIVGGTNRGKTFMFLPLTKIYSCFSCPSDNKFNWVGAPEKEVIFLNDFRYSENIMPWGHFLNFCEGATVGISMPKSHYAADYQWAERQPIFATADKKISRVTNGMFDEGETSQMNKRWTYIQFDHQLSDDVVNHDIIPCGKCFATLVLHFVNIEY